MIDNFNYLLEQCKKRKRQYIFKMVMQIVLGLILVSGSAIAYYIFALKNPQPPTAAASPKPLPVVEKPMEQNTSTVPESVTVAQPPLKPIVAQPVPSAPVTVTSVPSPAPAPAQKTSVLEVSTTASSVENLIASYQRSPNYETALSVARDFYTQKNFEQSALWAKKANVLNREAEEAWILYARSYYAQGRKNEAIGVLELYLNYKDSKTANELIKTWKTTP